MMKMRECYGLLFVLLIAIFSNSVYAEFNLLDGSCAGAAMGGHLLTAKGADAVFYNPAGLADSPKISLLTGHVDLFGLGTNHTVGVLSCSIKGLNTALLYDKINDDDLDYALSQYQISVAKNLGSKLSVGANLRFGKLDSAGGNGSALIADVGLIWKPAQRVKYALVLNNAVGSAKYDEEKESLPLGVDTGMEVTLADDTIISLSGSALTSNLPGWHIGMEKWFSKQLSTRIGLSNGNLTLGMGIKYGNWQFDYAYMPHQLGNTHRVAMKLEVPR